MTADLFRGEGIHIQEDELQLSLVFLLFREILIVSVIIVTLISVLEKKLNYHASFLSPLCHFSLCVIFSLSCEL